MKSKILRRTIILTLLVAMFAMTTMVEASPNYTYSFAFKDLVNHFEDYHEKGDGDTEQNWYFTIYNNGTGNVSKANVLGVKMNRLNNNTADRYRTFDYYPDKKPIAYLAYVAETDIMYLGAKKDNSSTSPVTLYANGAYNP